MKRKNKNISFNFPNGTRVQTRDEFLDKTDYFSPGHSNPKDLYRPTIVVSSNKNDELALSPLTTHSGKNIKNTISDYVYVYDSEGNPIVIDGVKFVVRKGKKLDKELLHSYLKHLFNNSNKALRNKYLIRIHIKKRK